MSPWALLGVGFLLGMRHATDADHVVAVCAIVARKRSFRAAAPVGILWGVGHTITLWLTGGGIILLGVVIPPALGLAMELCVALMLVFLGALNIRGRGRHVGSSAQLHAAVHAKQSPYSLRPIAVGIVHGLAGSAAIALLILGAISDPVWAVGYLLLFGLGTIAGMLLITMAMAIPVAALFARFELLHRSLGVIAGIASITFGFVLVYEIGFVHGLFRGHPNWTPY